MEGVKMGKKWSEIIIDRKEHEDSVFHYKESRMADVINVRIYQEIVYNIGGHEFIEVAWEGSAFFPAEDDNATEFMVSLEESLQREVQEKINKIVEKKRAFDTIKEFLENKGYEVNVVEEYKKE